MGSLRQFCNLELLVAVLFVCFWAWNEKEPSSYPKKLIAVVCLPGWLCCQAAAILQALGSTPALHCAAMHSVSASHITEFYAHDIWSEGLWAAHDSFLWTGQQQGWCGFALGHQTCVFFSWLWQVAACVVLMHRSRIAKCQQELFTS